MVLAAPEAPPTNVRACASNCALMATMIVLADMRAAPTAGKDPLVAARTLWLETHPLLSEESHRREHDGS